MAWMTAIDMREDLVAVVARGSVRGTRRPGRNSRAAHNPGAGAACMSPVLGREERVAELAARLLAADPGRESVHCWGPCGRTAVNGRNARRLGWKTRDIVCGPGEQVEVICPDCFRRWGFIEPHQG